jgi:glycosyltransferase involved in cell wall biosynthesis
MRIALVADEDPGWGGIGTYTGTLGEALGALGHEVHLVLRGWEDDGVETLGGLTVHRVVVPEPSWRRGTVAAVSRLYVARESLLFSARVAAALRRIGPDVIEAPEFHAPGLVAALRRRGPAVVARLHAPAFVTARLAAERPSVDGRAGEALEALSAHAARAVTAPSAALAQAVRRRWRLRRVDVIPNPVDEHLFAPGSDAEAPASILVVGRVERGKGQDVLVEALPAIRDAVPEAHVRFVGDDGGAAAALARRAQALGVADALAFEGARAREELPGVYRSAAVCVVPSRFENFPYAAVEAMACGRPLVAARVGGLAEIVREGEDGLLVAPEDPAALAGAVASLLGDAAARRRLGAAARARVEAAFAARVVAARMAQRYAEVVL